LPSANQLRREIDEDIEQLTKQLTLSDLRQLSSYEVVSLEQFDTAAGEAAVSRCDLSFSSLAEMTRLATRSTRPLHGLRHVRPPRSRAAHAHPTASASAYLPLRC
jgi:hypothetical protein